MDNNLREWLAKGLPPDECLSSIYDIENVLLLINEIDHKISHYQELKRHRVKSIDAKISDLSAKNEVFRNIILSTMKKIAPGDKTIDFPDIGKVTRKQGSASLSVINEEAVIEFLEKNGPQDAIRVSKAIDKRKLNTFAGECKKTGTQIPGIIEVPGSESLSITFEKDDIKAASVVKPQDASYERVDIEELDALLV